MCWPVDSNLFFFFFFSSRRRHTRLTCDWSSDVCSSDLLAFLLFAAAVVRTAWVPRPVGYLMGLSGLTYRSEEHTSELQSHVNLVCRLLLEKKNNKAFIAASRWITHRTLLF